MKKRSGIQLALYALLLQQNGIENVGRFGIIPLTGAELSDDIVTGVIESAQIPQFETQAAAAGAGILAGDFWPPTSSVIIGDPFTGICGVGTEDDSENAEGEGADG